MSRIGIDIDDVLFPWFERAHNACEAAGITNGISPTSWECYADYGVTLEAWLEVIAEATLDGSLYSGAPYEGALDALQTLRDSGHTIHLVTARGFLAHGDLIRQQTLDWIMAHKVPHDSLTFSKRKGIMRLDAFLDDSLKNIAELDEAGIPAWLMDAPHNRHVEHPRRVFSVDEFASLFVGVSA